MKKWKHFVIPLASNDGQSLRDELDCWGNNGWEFVTIWRDPKGHQWLIFKREE